MEQIKILNWIIEVDKERTEAFYANMPSLSVSCGCLYCQNFEKVAPRLPRKFHELLVNLGVDIKKAAEVYELHEIKKGMHLYGGFYHLTGRIVQSDDSFLDAEYVDHRTRQAKFRQLEETFYVGFTTDLNLVEKDFPKPVLQMEFNGILPWLLNQSP